jgi:hypothetical protein
LAEDGARPIIFYNRFAYCWQPHGKGWTMMVNSIINQPLSCRSGDDFGKLEGHTFQMAIAR